MAISKTPPTLLSCSQLVKVREKEAPTERNCTGTPVAIPKSCIEFGPESCEGNAPTVYSMSRFASRPAEVGSWVLTPPSRVNNPNVVSEEISGRSSVRNDYDAR